MGWDRERRLPVLCFVTRGLPFMYTSYWVQSSRKSSARLLKQRSHDLKRSPEMGLTWLRLRRSETSPQRPGGCVVNRIRVHVQLDNPG